MIGPRQHTVERRTVTIDDVDIPNLLAHVKDKTGGRFMVSFRDSGGVSTIPKPAETWVVERNRNASMDWRFSQRRHSNAEYNVLVSDAEPGDHIVTGQTHRMRVVHAEINGGQYGYPVCDHASETDPSSYTLSKTPVTDASVMVFWNGSIVSPAAWTRSGAVLTLSGLTGTHTLVVYYQTVDS